MSQTRLAVRYYLPKANKKSAIDQMDIPPILRNYLKHDTWDDLSAPQKATKMNGELQGRSTEVQYV